MSDEYNSWPPGPPVIPMPKPHTIKRDMRTLVLLIVLFYVANIMVSAIVMAIPMLIQFSRSGDFGVLFSTLMDGNILSLASIMGIACGMLVFMIIRGKRLFTDVLAKPEVPVVHPVVVFTLVLATQAVQLINSLISSLVEMITSGFGFSFSEGYAQTVGSMMNPIGIVYIILIGPICEELIFRGACLNTLRRYGDTFAIVMSACLFGLYHIILFQIPYAIVIGVLLGFTAVKFGLKYSILVHAISNALAVFYMLLESTKYSPAIFMGIATLVVVLMVISERAKLVELWRGGLTETGGEFKAGFATDAFVVYLALTVFLGIWMMARS